MHLRFSPIAATLLLGAAFCVPAHSADETARVTKLRYADLRGADLGVGANLNEALPFPVTNPWNSYAWSLPVDPNSSAIIASIGLNTPLHADFGAGLYEGKPVGIPYVVVSGKQRAVDVEIGAYAHESDPGPYPIPPNAPIEGGPNGTDDRHVVVIDRDNNRLYELFRAFPNPDGSWKADSGAIFHLDSNRVRPLAGDGWSSADAAGLPIFPGLVRYDEASRGLIAHALRFTVQRSRKAYVPPATHWASPNPSPDLPPMGMRVRLKASFNIPESFSTEGRAILQALKTYGMFVADNGANWFLSGAPDARWNNDRLRRELGSVHGADFEVVRMDGLVHP
jgi:hypothetical protein